MRDSRYQEQIAFPTLKIEKTFRGNLLNSLTNEFVYFTNHHPVSGTKSFDFHISSAVCRVHTWYEMENSYILIMPSNTIAAIDKHSGVMQVD